MALSLPNLLVQRHGTAPARTGAVACVAIRSAICSVRRSTTGLWSACRLWSASCWTVPGRARAHNARPTMPLPSAQPPNRSSGRAARPTARAAAAAAAPPGGAAATGTGEHLLQGLAPVAGPGTRLLVLGSFPGQASLAAQQYYGHPRNAFWPLLGALWGVDDLAAQPYAQRLAMAQARGLGLWDVYAACHRQGSLDSAIRQAQPNDLAGLAAALPALQAIAHNGGESARAMRVTQALGLPVYRLPSTSPANAGWSFARKLAAWRTVFERHGLA